MLDQQQTRHSGQHKGRSRGSVSSGKSGGDDRVQQGCEHGMDLLDGKGNAVVDDGAKPIDFKGMKCA